MAQPITWRNINAPSQSDAARLAISGNQALSAGLKSIGSAAGQVNTNNINNDKREATENTQNITNLITGLDSFELNRAKESGTFTPEALQAQYGKNVDTKAVLAALDNQDNKIFADSQEGVLRDLTLQKQGDDAVNRDRTLARRDILDKQTANQDITLAQNFEDSQINRNESSTIKDATLQLSDLAANLSPDLSMNQKLKILEDTTLTRGLPREALDTVKADVITSINEARLSNKEQEQINTAIAEDAAKVDLQYKIQEETHNALKASQKKNSALSPDERAEQEVKLNEYLSKLVDDSYFDDEDEKEAAINYGESLDASPAQMQAAISRVSAPSGGFNQKDYERVLAEMLKDDKGDLLSQAIKESQNKLNATRIGLQGLKSTNKAKILQDFDKRLGISQ